MEEWESGAAGPVPGVGARRGRGRRRPVGAWASRGTP
jgi:hypothetical protein